MGIQTEGQIQDRGLGIDPRSAVPQFTNIQIVNDPVRQASAWVKPLEQEVSRVIVGQRYLIERLMERMSLYSVLIAKKLGLWDNEVQDICYTAPMHDLGKVGIPDSILMKKGKLTKEEFDVIKTHSAIGAKILSNSKSDIIKTAEQIALTHHEKWNGKGYPQGLSGKKIPLVGRIVCLADTFDALTSKRPYKDPYPTEVACEIIKKEYGEQFDPDVADVFLENIDEALKIKAKVGSTEDVLLSDFTKSERDLLEREEK